MYCRTTEERERICSEYKVEPFAHRVLLPGQIIPSDAGGNITTNYYLFHAKKDDFEDFITVGMGAARDFLKLLKHPGLRIINPLQNLNTVNRNENGNYGSDNDNSINEVWNPLSRQLYLACNLFAMLIGAKPNYGIYDIIYKIYKFRREDKYILSKIENANKYMKSYFDERDENSLTELINSSEYNFRTDFFDFNLINNELKKNNIVSYF